MRPAYRRSGAKKNRQGCVGASPRPLPATPPSRGRAEERRRARACRAIYRAAGPALAGGSGAARTSSRPWHPRPPPTPTCPWATAPLAARSARRGRGTPRACSCTSTAMKVTTCRQARAGRPPGPAAARCPQGARRRTSSRESRTGADRRRRRAVKSLLRRGGRGRSTLGIMQAAVLIAAGGRSRGAQAQMTAGRGRAGVQRLKANFLRGCDGQGRPRPRGGQGRGPGKGPPAASPAMGASGRERCPASTPWTGAAPAVSFVGGGRVASPASPRAAAALRSDAAMKGFNTVGRRGRPAGGDGVEDTDDRRL